MDSPVLIVIAALLAVNAALLILLLVKNSGGKDLRGENERLKNELNLLLGNMQSSISARIDGISNMQQQQLGAMSEQNAKSIARFNDSVSAQLVQVHKDIGQMQTLAQSVGDLKKIMSNVKTRGILGEMQLGAILSEMLSPYQYETNIVTKKGSRDPVEFALRLPGGDSPVYVPIDSKFPVEAYLRLREALDASQQQTADEQRRELYTSVKRFAKDIHDKYIAPPNTTDFAIMFLPAEGLYIEIVSNTALFEQLKKDYGILVAGPSTLCAFLSSLQLGFKSLAVHRHAADVWDALRKIKAEFTSFATVLESAQKRIAGVSDDLDKLIGVRTRKILSQLDKIEETDEEK